MDTYKDHQCPLMPKSGVTIYTQFAETDSKSSTSKMVVERQATEDDLEENHVLEELGESIWTFSAEIYNCPYCGMELTAPGDLNDEDEESDDGYGSFSLFDQEKWSGRQR